MADGIDLDNRVASIQKGQVARLIRNTTEDWLTDREYDLIANLTNKYRSGTLTNDDLRGTFGEIAGLRFFREYLETQIRRGMSSPNVEIQENA